MKKLLFVMIMVAGAVTGHGQQSDYQPMVREGVVWVYYYKNVVLDERERPDLQDAFYRMEFKGETEINGKTYHNCYHYFTDKLDAAGEVPVAFVREQDRRVYVVFNDAFECDDVIYQQKNRNPKSEDYEDSGEYLVYDFADMGQYCAMSPVSGLAPDGEETVQVGSNSCKRYYLSQNGVRRYSIVEGVGCETPVQGNLLIPLKLLANCTCDETRGLSHLEDASGRVLYQGPYYEKYQLTGVEELSVDKPADGGNCYNLMGQPVAHPEAAPGIYIRNGKKVLVR